MNRPKDNVAAETVHFVPVALDRKRYGLTRIGYSKQPVPAIYNSCSTNMGFLHLIVLY